MKDHCLDIGLTQAFLDCELSQEETSHVAGHIATCDACALMLAEAEEESAMVFSALEREMNTLVPTQRLWNKINDSIAIEKSRTPFWQKAFAFLSVNLLNPSFAGAAAVLIVAGVFAIVWLNRSVVNEPTTVAGIPTQPLMTGSSAVPQNVNPGTGSRTAAPSRTVDTVAYRPESRRIVATPAVATSVVPAAENYLPGEESYVKTISTLSKTVNQKKDNLLGASERVAFERNMAMVNDSINKLKREVRRNPRNTSAKQVLYSSYQNKIDLLNSVTQKEELMSTLVD